MATEAGSTPGTSAALRRGLECLIGRYRFGVPVEAVQQVVDLELGPPPPLARGWVSGLGVYQGRALLAVSLLSAGGKERRQAKGVWLAAGGAPSTYLLEVTRVEALVGAELQPRRVTIGKHLLPGYVCGALAAPSRAIGWIDVAAMLRALEGEA